MLKNGLFVHSPFSPLLLAKEENKVLLLQFVLSALIHAVQQERAGRRQELYLCPLGSYPYDWTFQSGSLNKTQEHAVLLRSAFPQHLELVEQFQQQLEKICQKICRSQQPILEDLQQLFKLLIPLCEQYRFNENLLYFMVKKHEELAFLFTDWVEQFFPEGLDRMQEHLCNRYLERGMNTLIEEIEQGINTICSVKTRE